MIIADVVVLTSDVDYPMENISDKYEKLTFQHFFSNFNEKKLVWKRVRYNILWRARPTLS